MDNKFSLYLQNIRNKNPELLKQSYENESSIINAYMIANNLCGLDTRISLESIYKAFLKNPELMLSN
jgi:hypothetical protein